MKKSIIFIHIPTKHKDNEKLRARKYYRTVSFVIVDGNVRKASLNNLLHRSYYVWGDIFSKSFDTRIVNPYRTHMPSCPQTLASTIQLQTEFTLGFQLTESFPGWKKTLWRKKWHNKESVPWQTSTLPNGEFCRLIPGQNWPYMPPLLITVWFAIQMAPHAAVKWINKNLKGHH